MAGIVADVLERGRRLARLALLPVFLVAPLLPAGRAAAAPPEVSFDPAPQSPDFLDLFTHPESWAEARRRINIFIIGPAHLKHGEGGNSFEQLVAVDAFRKLQQWGIKTEIAVGVIKNWDCAAKTTAERTLTSIADIHRHGGKVDLVSMDEPLLAAVRLQLNDVERCHLSIAQAAQETAAFTKQVAAGVTAQQLGPVPGFIDIEPYPSVQLDQHQAYITALLAQGFHPAGYMLDIALGQIERRPEVQKRFPADLRALKAFLEARQIPLSIILWSSRSPEPTDQSYYEDTLAFTRQIHGILGQPAGVVFSSWVKHCAKGEAGDCPKSVPANLPERGAAGFSHTRLILDALNILAQR